jgi:chemotaxis protein methyltransferase WspC
LIRPSFTSLDVTPIGDWLSCNTGISPAIIGVSTLQRAVAKRLDAQALDDPQVYLALLLNSEQEQDALVELLVVPETWFFRDRQPFVHLQAHVTQRLADVSNQAPLRLLSAPCSSGEEPYSLAMTLLDLGIPASHFRIDAVDICKPSIRKARKAIYSKHSFRGVPPSERNRHFQATAEGFALDPTIASTVRFHPANLMRCLEGIGGPYDVVFCRNLLIYLEDQASAYLLETIAALLKPGGLLVVGSAEMGKVPGDLFQPLRQSVVFGFERRSPGGGGGPSPAPAEPRSLAALPPTSYAQPPPATSAPRQRPRPLRLQAGRPSPGILNAASVPLAPGAADGPQAELERCRRRLELDPTSDRTYLRMADLLLQLQQKQEAFDCLQKSLYLQPQSQDALRKLIALSRELGQLEQSQRFEARLARLNA